MVYVYSNSQTLQTQTTTHSLRRTHFIKRMVVRDLLLFYITSGDTVHRLYMALSQQGNLISQDDRSNEQG